MNSPEIVHTDKAPEAIGPYSQAIHLHNLIFTSGQIPVDPEAGTMPDGIRAQTGRAFSNLRAVLEAAGSGMDRVLKTTVFLRSMDDFSLMNEVYAEFFSPPFPARSCVAVRELPKNAQIEIEAIAWRK